MNDLKKQYEQETERNPVYQIQPHDAGFKMPSLGYIEWLEAKLQTPQPEGVKPEVNPKDISHAIFRATHERGWFHEKDTLDILSKYTITAK